MASDTETAAIERRFREIEEQATFRMDQRLRWGYWFEHADPALLGALEHELRRRGYRLGPSQRAEDGKRFTVRAEREGAQSAAGLAERNEELQVLASGFGAEYVDWEVGEIPAEGQAVPIRGGARFLGNLNVYLAAAPVLAMYAGSFIGIFAMIALGSAGMLAGYAVPAAILVFVWWKVGLIPKNVAANRVGLYRAGQGAVALSWLAMFGSMGIPIVLAQVTGNSSYLGLMWFSLLAFFVGPLILLAGFALIWSAGTSVSGS